ncbi:site-specific integrase [Telmatobacter sp. DSM 110680]|uniref:Site-specific integrase n=1 Tax=Telmatobacter sp. DSM 110680 TaxID=3036704 RepID=A0AAU7DF36_9BACT
MGTQPRKTRGLFERPPGSGIWWINYYVKGKQHREKVGRRSDAIALYQKRKADARLGVKLPELQPRKTTTFGELALAAVDYAKAHLRTWADYDWKERALREEFGSRSAAEITPQEIDRFLTGRCKTPATANRFRAFFSLCYRLGMENGRVSANPARLVRMRRENNARLRFLSRDEYKELSNIILRHFPEQHSAFVVSVYTGMRWGEQFSLTWTQVDMRRKIIRLTQTKNGSARNVPLNSTALDALRAQQAIVPHKLTDQVFPEAGDYCRFWFEPSIKDAGITGYTWHCNRHTFCSWLAMAGVSLKEIQTLAGHKTITMAARYAHLSPDAAASASERMVMHPSV